MSPFIHNILSSAGAWKQQQKNQSLDQFLIVISVVNKLNTQIDANMMCTNNLVYHLTVIQNKRKKWRQTYLNSLDLHLLYEFSKNTWMRYVTKIKQEIEYFNNTETQKVY